MIVLVVIVSEAWQSHKKYNENESQARRQAKQRDESSDASVRLRMLSASIHEMHKHFNSLSCTRFYRYIAFRSRMTPCDGERYFNNHSLSFQSHKVVNNQVYIKGKRKIEKVRLRWLTAPVRIVILNAVKDLKRNTHEIDSSL